MTQGVGEKDLKVDFAMWKYVVRGCGTVWAESNLRRVWASGCDAVWGDRQFKKHLGDGCDTVEAESQFEEGFGKRICRVGGRGHFRQVCERQM